MAWAYDDYCFFCISRLAPVSGRGEIGSFLGIQSSLFTFDGLIHLIMPATNLALFKIAMVIRLARAGTEEVMSFDFINLLVQEGCLLKE